MRKMFGLAGLAIVFALAGSPVALADCASGYSFPDGTCAPGPGVWVRCNNGSFCRGGNLCTQEGGCLPLGDPRVCPGGRTYCAYGYCGARDGQCHRE